MSTPALDLQQLVSRLLDGQLTEAERQQLNDLLRDNPAAQEKYRELMSLHALLHLDFVQGYRNLLPPLVEKQPPTVADGLSAELRDFEQSGEAPLKSVASRNPVTQQPKRSSSALVSAALAASVLFVIAGAWWTNRQNSINAQQAAKLSAANQSATEQDRRALNVSAAQSVAVLGQAAGAKWMAPGSIPDVGGALPAGEFELAGGLIQLEFLSGAAVVIEGPAKFELVSENLLICQRGKLRAHVPAQAHGFRIETPNIAAVDLGTEFTIDVNQAGQADFHVLEGEVELWDLKPKGSSPNETLTTGLSARATADGRLFQVALKQAPVVSSQQLLELSERTQQQRYADWRRFSSKLSSRPDVLVYYGFNQHDAWERELRNEGTNASETLTGAIVGCQWTTGRWIGKQALEFKRITDRVRLNVPGEFQSLTYSAWVRIEGLERWLTSLMLTDGHEPNEVHWQITELGTLLLGVNDDAGNLHDYFSPRALGHGDLGRWVHLAAVLDGASGTVQHYLDGKQISSERIKNPSLFRLGKSEIGNWAPNDRPGYRTRSLNGRIDEFILFSSPLSGQQILEIYEAGKPGS